MKRGGGGEKKTKDILFSAQRDTADGQMIQFFSCLIVFNSLP